MNDCELQVTVRMTMIVNHGEVFDCSVMLDLVETDACWWRVLRVRAGRHMNTGSISLHSPPKDLNYSDEGLMVVWWFSTHARDQTCFDEALNTSVTLK